MGVPAQVLGTAKTPKFNIIWDRKWRIFGLKTAPDIPQTRRNPWDRNTAAWDRKTAEILHNLGP